MDEPNRIEQRSMARAAGVVMTGFALSNLTGLVKWVLVSQAFGTEAELDAFNAANRLPEILFNLMAGGALASAFVPTFTELLTSGLQQRAWKLASSVANIVFLVLSLTAAVAYAAAGWLVPNVLSPGFDSATMSLTIQLLRILLLSAVLFGLSGLLMGILNAHRHFLLPALAPTFLWIGWIVGVLFFVPRWGIHGLAWGVVLGAAMHLSVQLPGLRGRGATYTARLGLEDPAVRQVGKLMAPRLLGVAAVQLNFLVNTILASGMREGSLTAIGISFFVMLMPQVVIAQSIAVAALPTFSAQAARKDLPQLRSTLAATLRGVAFLSLPASLGLILLRRPIVSILFERGAFDAQSTELVSWALLWYAAGLLGHAVVEIASRAFYALKDTRTPVLLGVGAMGLNIGLSLTLPALFRLWGWLPHGGLALANSIATGLEGIGLLVLMRRRLGGLDFNRIQRGLLGAVAASVAMVAALLLWLPTTSTWSLWLRGLGGVALGAAVYSLTSLLLRAPELSALPSLILERDAGALGRLTQERHDDLGHNQP